jgi:hypothetical protein
MLASVPSKSILEAPAERAKWPRFPEDSHARTGHPRSFGLYCLWFSLTIFA